MGAGTSGRAAKERSVVYTPDDRLELEVVLYLDEIQLRFHDLDNRVKDIMDALQGRVGGGSGPSAYTPIIPNNHQIHRLTVEKKLPSGQSHGLGHVTVRRHEGDARRKTGALRKEKAKRSPE